MKSQVRRAPLMLLVGSVALMGAVACAAKVDESPRESEPKAQELRQKHDRHFRGPVAVVIDAARTHGNLKADQAATLDAISSELADDCGSHRALHDRLKSSAVAVVRSGSARSAEFDRSVDEAVGAIEARVQRSTDALEEIHAILDVDQRKAVAVALRARIADKFGRGPRDEKRQREGFRRFASHLMLSSLQIDKLEAAKQELFGEREKLRPSREELLELVEAFEGEDFPAALLAFRQKKSKVLRERVARAGERTDSVLTIFTPEQRELLADLIVDGPRKVLFGEEIAPEER
ncbi:MAG: hypothetical protein HS104_41805 [Polyangiaceae bacterium]|nr:hypothetical protein [Polyangiaceae bacterium]MCE7893854.1 hypothetical protein [Sorangiineae bacterium PRO1]MCL4751606.1 hypothetical protein [Myxococcales bacterium]